MCFHFGPTRCTSQVATGKYTMRHQKCEGLWLRRMYTVYKHATADTLNYAKLISRIVAFCSGSFLQRYCELQSVHGGWEAVAVSVISSYSNSSCVSNQ